MGEKALKAFSAKVMLENIEHLRTLVQRIRQKDGGIGSIEDEMSLHRAIHDLDLLVDIVDGLKASYDELRGQFDTVVAQATAYQAQQSGLKETYERMLHERNELIKELKAQLPTEEEPEQE